MEKCPVCNEEIKSGEGISKIHSIIEVEGTEEVQIDFSCQFTDPQNSWTAICKQCAASVLLSTGKSLYEGEAGE